MNHWDSIRLQACRVRAQALEISGGDVSPDALLRALAEITRIKSQGLPKGHNLLFGAKATIDTFMVWFDSDVEQWEQYFNQVHEYAHYFRHGKNFICGGDDINSQATEDAINMGAQAVDGYGPHERRELEANVFALEFLLPGNELRESFLAGTNAEKIAVESQMPEPMVIHVLMRAVLGVELEIDQEAGKESKEQDEEPDDDQEDAVTAGEKEITDQVPPRTILVDAGPGTGKTKTLIKRISRLTGHRQVHASKILALTFSNKAAEEIYVRVSTHLDRDLSQAWMGTFHKFGLDLIRKYYKKLGLTPNPKVLDTLDARLLLEQNLGELRLHHFRSLDHPSRFLKTILDRVSRAKDDLIGPADYLRRAEAHYEAVKNNRSVGKDVIKKAEEDLEVAHSYIVYQTLLQTKNQLDYGDLIARSVELLLKNEDVLKREQERFEHILIDEYQDVNHASRILLKLLADEGRGLWVVGDLRQAIYRFRGASPRNMILLTSEDFPNAETIRLGSNYRSQEPILTVFAGCATAMRSDGAEEKWVPRRTQDGKAEIRYLVSSDEKAEAADLVSEIKRLQEDGVDYRNQAVLCRYHDDLARLSDALESAGIPVLYLGNFFERPEVRDLLSIVALATETDGRALYRLANFSEYGFSRDGIKLFTDHAYKNQIRFPAALQHISEVEELSSDEKNKLGLVADHVDGFHFGSSSWQVLSQYLFVKSNYLRFLAADDSVRGQQMRLAIYQLLLFAYQLKDEFSEPDRKGDKKWHFLNYLRQIRIDKDDRQLRQPPNWADDINAVRLMTIHTAKGLEWRAVHLPMLSDGKFPRQNYTDQNRGKSQTAPAVEIAWQDEEENCLFFVALSRARDHLCLYRGRRYGFRDKPQSRLLKLISKHLPSAICNPPERVPPPARESKQVPSINVKREYNARELSVYLKCPLEYEYRYVLGLSSPRSDTPMGRTHLAVFRVGEAIKKAQASGQKITKEFVENKIAQVWTECGPVTHPYEPDYQNEARQMIRRIFERDPKSEDRIIQPDWRVELSNGFVVVKPDYVDFFDEDGKMNVVVEKLNFGNSPDKFEEDDVYPIFEKAVSENFPDFERRIQATFMGDSQTVPVSIGQTWRKRSIANFERAINGILAEDFSPRVNSKLCPFCSYYVICSSND